MKIIDELPGRTAEGPVKLSDVASAARVALSTASRALSNPDRVNVKTRMRVLAAAARLGYASNVAARSLRSGLSRTILVVMPPWRSRGVLDDAMRGVDAKLMSAGYSMITGSLNEDFTADHRLIDMARGGLVDGILAVANELPAGGPLPVLSARLPAVGLMIDLSVHGIPSVLTNDREAVSALTTKLIAIGRRRLVYLGGPPDNYHDVERFAGFSFSLQKEGLASTRLEGDFNFASGERAAAQYLALEHRPDAVVCANDDMAIGFMKGVRAAGLRIPEDVAVTGFDGGDFAAYTSPGLTTLRQPAEQMGAASASLLLQMINGEDPPVFQRMIVSSILDERGSTPSLGAGKV
jgi:LacI family repressor for deo operon, udp, cdd, tsx, nupC, and nupG